MNLRFHFGPANFLCLLLLAVAVLAGCGGPEMPVPPPRVSTNPAEDDFAWAMERMEHAITMFQPPSGLGLSVKRTLDYKLFPPTDSQPNYTAQVTITVRSTFNHGVTSSAKERQEKIKKGSGNQIKLDDPYSLPNDEQLANDNLGINVPPVEPSTQEVVEPSIPAQKLEEKNVYLLEYVDNRWQLETNSLEKNERMWFDYALEQDLDDKESNKKS